MKEFELYTGVKLYVRYAVFTGGPNLPPLKLKEYKTTDTFTPYDIIIERGRRESDVDIIHYQVFCYKTKDGDVLPIPPNVAPIRVYQLLDTNMTVEEILQFINL